jgi:V-ATPase subunit H
MEMPKMSLYRALKLHLIFREYAKKRKESVWAQFLNLLNRPDTFIQNMAAR